MAETADSLVRLVVLALGIVLLVPLVLMLILMPMMGWMWGGMANGAMGWGMGGLLGWLLVLALVAGVGYVLYRGLPPDETDPAVEELRLAYARGELDDEEFEQRRRRLESE